MSRLTIFGGMMVFLAGLVTQASAQSIDPEDVNTAGGNEPAVTTRALPLVSRLSDLTGGGLSSSDVESLFKDVESLIDPKAPFSPASAGLTESEIGRHLGLLRKVEKDLYTPAPGKTVENLFDAEFQDSPVTASAPTLGSHEVASLIEGYDRLHTALHVLKTYSFLAQGPVTTYKGPAGSQDVVEEARHQLDSARTEAKNALAGLRSLIAVSTR